MAGSPLKRAEQIAISEHEERIFEMLDEGRTQFEISRELGYRQSSISRWLNATPERKAKLAASRELASDTLIEQSLDIVDGVQGIDNAEIGAAKLKAETRLRIAAFWNRDKYGDNKAGVTVNIGTLHLDALRAAAVEPLPFVEAVQTLPTLGEAVATLQSSDEGIVDVVPIERAPSGDEFGLM